jgi:enoyl-CoA hydratase
MSDIIKMEMPAEGICRIVMNRPERGNAQNNELLYALDAALTEASRDVSIRVIILAGEGKHFSSGHDLGQFDQTLEGIDTVGVWGGFSMPAMEGYMAFEEEAYFGLCWRWRNIPKPIIAEVQGKVIAAGLMLAWICDIIVASEDATFTDPVVAAGANGVEYFAHPWEVGVRKAKEMLFTGQGISAKTAERLGMVNRVISRDRLTAETLELAQIIAEKPVMGVRLAKMSVNQTQDEQGFYNAQSWAVHGDSADASAGALIRRTLGLPLLP